MLWWNLIYLFKLWNPATLASSLTSYQHQEHCLHRPLNQVMAINS